VKGEGRERRGGRAGEEGEGQRGLTPQIELPVQWSGTHYVMNSRDAECCFKQLLKTILFSPC